MYSLFQVLSSFQMELLVMYMYVYFNKEEQQFIWTQLITNHACIFNPIVLSSTNMRADEWVQSPNWALTCTDTAHTTDAIFINY